MAVDLDPGQVGPQGPQGASGSGAQGPQGPQGSALLEPLVPTEVVYGSASSGPQQSTAFTFDETTNALTVGDRKYNAPFGTVFGPATAAVLSTLGELHIVAKPNDGLGGLASNIVFWTTGFQDGNYLPDFSIHPTPDNASAAPGSHSIFAVAPVDIGVNDDNYGTEQSALALVVGQPGGGGTATIIRPLVVKNGGGVSNTANLPFWINPTGSVQINGADGITEPLAPDSNSYGDKISLFSNPGAHAGVGLRDLGVIVYSPNADESGGLDIRITAAAASRSSGISAHRLDNAGRIYSGQNAFEYLGGTGPAIKLGDCSAQPVFTTFGFTMYSAGGHPRFLSDDSSIISLVQQPAVPSPAGGGTIDAEARTAIDDIIGKLQTIGLLA